MIDRQHWKHPVLRTVGPLVVAVLLVGACSPESTPSPVPSAASTPLPTPVTSQYTLGVTGWYGGLVIHFDTASSVLDEGGGSVAVDLRLENPGPELASLDAPILLVSGDASVEPVRGTDIPNVPSGASSGTTIVFNVDGTFQLPIAVIKVGRPAEHEVIVPLVAGGQVPVTLDPMALTASGSATAGSLTLTLKSGELRADLPDWGIELERDKLALTLTYSARYRGTFAGGFPFTGANVGLQLPDGTIIASRSDGRSQSIAVLAPGVTVPDLIARFEVAAPGLGAYALIVRDGSHSARIPFTIDLVAPEG